MYDTYKVYECEEACRCGTGGYVVSLYAFSVDPERMIWHRAPKHFEFRGDAIAYGESVVLPTSTTLMKKL